jgi:hypothetical protein
MANPWLELSVWRMGVSRKDAPRVFISSTNLDLQRYRQAAVLGANAAGFVAELQENWTAEDHPPLEACLQRARQTEVLLVLVAHRYGWVPEDAKRNPDGKSITWLRRL